MQLYYLTRQIVLVSDGPENGRVLAATGPSYIKVARLSASLRRVSKTDFHMAPEFETIKYLWDGSFDSAGRAVYRVVEQPRFCEVAS